MKIIVTGCTIFFVLLIGLTSLQAKDCQNNTNNFDYELQQPFYAAFDAKSDLSGLQETIFMAATAHSKGSITAQDLAALPLNRRFIIYRSLS